MFDEPFRARFDVAVRPLGRWLVARGVTANAISLATFFFALIAAALIAFGYAWAGLAVWLLSRIGDGFDGVVARVGQSSSPFGGLLDITLDMAGYSAMVLAFAIVHPAAALAWTSVLAGYVLVITTTLALSDAARAAAQRVSATNRTFQFTGGLAEAGETTVMYTLWVLFPQHVLWLAWLWVVVLVATALQHMVQAWGYLGSAGNE